MDEKTRPPGIPREGFIKIGSQKVDALTGHQKSALIRRGNELFNAGDVDRAKRIFLTTGYTDGLTRVGDALYKKRDVLEALRMYWMAPAPDRKEAMIGRMAGIVQEWLREDESQVE